jgi:3-oxoacyl-[acyl-carrier-protein] synthase II
MSAYLTGGSWITADGWGLWSAQESARLTCASPMPPTRKEFDKAPTRYGRFDPYTRLGWAGIALALRDVGLDQGEERRPIGIVAASRNECLATDEEYYRTTLDEGGSLSSPQLFSYTLPNIVLGECAVQFKLSGPTLSVGDDGALGARALETALRFIECGEAPAMVAGWLESDADEEWEAPLGALFVVLEAQPRNVLPEWRLEFKKGAITRKGGQVKSLCDLFPNLLIEQNGD